jgi:argininosuccinate lyase
MAQEKSWQARISEATDKLAQSFVESISYDRRMYKQDIVGSIAQANMLAKAGLISAADRDAILSGLQSIKKDIEAGIFVFDESLEDIHMVVEDALIKRIGEPGRKLHTGRSRNDQVALDFRLWINDAAIETTKLLSDMDRALYELAMRSKDVVMPSYTHMQRAQPISAAAEVLCWARMFQADRKRMSQLLKEHHESPLGSGAIAGCSLPISPADTALELGFDHPPVSSIEQTASRDQALEYVFALSLIAQHLSRWAEQWIIYMSTEFSFLKIADRYTTSSSMMPQKRNPDMMELIRGLVALMTLMKGLPIGYNRDLQEDKRLTFRAHDTAISCLTMATAIIATASYIKENIHPTLHKGFLDATSLAEFLVSQGIPFRTAHHIVGTLVAHCEKTGRKALAELTVDQFNEVIAAHQIDVKLDDHVKDCLGAENVVKRYQSQGAAGGKPLEKSLADWGKTM